MKTIRILPALLGLALAASVRADVPPDEKSTLTISEPLEVPGIVLQAGTYVVKLVDSQSDHNVVVFTSADERKVYAMAIATPHVAASDPRHSTFLFYPVTDGAARTLRTWYASNDRYGQDFVYPAARAAALRGTTNEQVPALTDAQTQELANRAQAAPAAVTSDAEPAPPPSTAPIPMTSATSPMGSPAPADSDHGSTAGTDGTSADSTTTLPRTASSTPLLLVLGVVSLSLALAVRRGSRLTSSIGAKDGR